MKQKASFIIMGSLICIAASFILYQRGVLTGYEKGYKNASEVFSRTGSQSKTE